MITPLYALEVIKNAPTIYVGCGSDIYTRYPIEISTIETALKVLEIIKENCYLHEFLDFVCIISKRYISDKQKRDLLKEFFK